MVRGLNAAYLLVGVECMAESGIDECVLNYSRLRALGRPQSRNHRSLFNWIWVNKPLAAGYSDFVYQIDDFVCATGSHSNFFEERMQAYFNSSPRSWFKVRRITYLVISRKRDKGRRKVTL
jgi:hypothetical protein